MFFDPFYSSYLGRGEVSLGSATRAESAARKAETKVELFQHDIDRLLMITEALWTLLKQEHGYQDEMLVKMIQEIDLRDGKLDGRLTKEPPTECPSCGRVNSPKRARLHLLRCCHPEEAV